MAHAGRSTSTILASAGVLMAAGAFAPVAAEPDPVAPTTCQGKPVTIVADGTVTKGTEGDDVVAMVPGGWIWFDALGGDDTICLAYGVGWRGSRDSMPHTGSVDAGAGNDTVVNEGPPESFSQTRVGLGPGADTYVGVTAGGESIAADAESDRTYLPPAGDQRDVLVLRNQSVTSWGAADTWVTTAAAAGAHNEDHITVTGVGANISYSGTMGPSGAVDVSPTASATALDIDVPRSRAESDLLVDATARTVALDRAPLLTWNGPIGEFGFHRDTAAADARVSFVGTDAAETVSVEAGGLRDFHLGGGDDELHLRGDSAEVPRVADGGTGDDDLLIDDLKCRSLALRLGDRATCDAAKGVVAGFENATIEALDHGGPVWPADVLLVGTPGANRLVIGGDYYEGPIREATVVGRGGNDDVRTVAKAVRVRGGTGADRLEADGKDVVLRGGDGRDHVKLDGYGATSRGCSPSVEQPPTRSWDPTASTRTS